MSKNKQEQRNSTIIITDKYSHETKIYNINQKYIERFGWYKKVFLSSVGCLFLLLTGLVSYIGYEHHQKQQLNDRLATMKGNLENAVSNASDSNSKLQQMWNNLNKADSSLQKIEKYLSDRDVKLPNIANQNNKANVGGEYYPANTINADLIQSKANELADLLGKVKVMPIGLPHQGNITSLFGERGNPVSGTGAEFHPGLDLSGNIGDPIRATADGVVVFAGQKGGYGNCVMLKHGFGYETLYGHMSKILVSEGQKIKAGMPVGLLGSTGRSTGPHVHYEVIYNNEKQNPRRFLNIN